MISDCVILAAGLGSRLANLGEVKPLVELNGIPLIHRAMNAVYQAGIARFTIVLGFRAEKIEKSVLAFVKNRNLSCRFVFNPQWQKANGVSVLAVEEHIHSPFLLTMSDHLFGPELIKKALDVGLEEDGLRLAVDKRIVGNSFVDIDDVTRVKLQGDRIVNIGKQLCEYNAFDTGVFLVDQTLFRALRQSAASGDDSLSGGVQQLASSGRAGAIDIEDMSWIDVDDENAWKKASILFK